MSGCVVKRTTRVAKSQVPPPPRVASTEALVTAINAQSAAVSTISATVEMQPATGSVYSGIIKQYHDVRGILLAERPGRIRVLGQAPVVRTDLFDMAADGSHFSLYIPSQNKFYVGDASVTRSAKNSLERLRPQHILSALFLDSINAGKESYFAEEVDHGARQYYVIGVIGPLTSGRVTLERKIWFDRSSLQISRVQVYGPKGEYLEDIHYSGYVESAGIRYPYRIEINRPIEGYSLALTILHATFNQPIAPGKFSLTQPPGAQVIDLEPPSGTGGSGDR